MQSHPPRLAGKIKNAIQPIQITEQKMLMAETQRFFAEFSG